MAVSNCWTSTSNLSDSHRLRNESDNKVTTRFQINFIECLLTFLSFLLHKELEAAQKAAESTATPTNPAQPLSGEESETGSVTETPEKSTPTPDYAAGLLPSNPPPTPATPVTPLASTSIPPLTPLKEQLPPRMVAVRPPPTPSISSLPPASPAAPAQVVRLVTTQPAASTPAAVAGSTTVPTVYRLVQPAAAAGQPVAVATATPNQPAAPPKKSVALMLTVSLHFRPVAFEVNDYL
jgi:hypothetical protein